jgi:hypothetical protein
MIVVGAIISLDDGELGAAASEALHADPRLEVGRDDGRRVAVCGTTATRRDDACLWDELKARPGVSFIDFVFASFEPDDEQR